MRPVLVCVLFALLFLQIALAKDLIRVKIRDRKAEIAAQSQDQVHERITLEGGNSVNILKGTSMESLADSGPVVGQAGTTTNTVM